MRKEKKIFYGVNFNGGGKHFYARYNDFDEVYTLYVYALDENDSFLETYKKAIKNGLTNLPYKQVNEICLYITGLDPDSFENGKLNYLFNKALVKRLAKIGKR